MSPIRIRHRWAFRRRPRGSTRVRTADEGTGLGCRLRYDDHRRSRGLAELQVRAPRLARRSCGDDVVLAVGETNSANPVNFVYEPADGLSKDGVFADGGLCRPYRGANKGFHIMRPGLQDDGPGQLRSRS